MQKVIVTLLGILMIQCIGTDIVDDLTSTSFRIEVQSPDRSALLIGETLKLSAQHLTQENEVLPSRNFVWRSSQPRIAEIDQEGVVTAISIGQTMITASIGEIQSEEIQISIVSDDAQVAEVRILTQSIVLQISESLQLEAEAYNIDGMLLSDAVLSWESSAPEIVSVTENGLLTAIANGTSRISALANGIRSNPLVINVGASLREGEFEGVASYNASGMVSLGQNNNGDLILSTSQDFMASFALGTFIYLSNSKDGGETFSDGLEIADISENPQGAKTFNISDINSNVEVDTYQYVIILCKPARITFGLAELN